MCRAVHLAVLFFSLSFSAEAQGLKPTVAEEYNRIEGIYTGTLFASGYDMPVETTFYLQDGVLHGEYIMNEKGTMTPGQLTRITFSGSSTIECIWEDKYGEGPASFTFSEDYSSFTGFWGTDNGVDRYIWWGAKEHEQVQHLLRD